MNIFSSGKSKIIIDMLKLDNSIFKGNKNSKYLDLVVKKGMIYERTIIKKKIIPVLISFLKEDFDKYKAIRIFNRPIKKIPFSV